MKFFKFGAGLMAVVQAFAGTAAMADTVAKIGETPYETLAAAFADAKDGDTINLLAASYTENDLGAIEKLNNKKVVVVGLGMDKTELKVVYGQGASDVNGLHFQDLALTINHSGYSMPYTQTLCGTYERVKINGLIAVDHGTSTFTDCVFTGTTTGDEYILWQYAGVMLVERCTFKASASKGVVKLYCESSYEARNLVKDCVFESVTGSKGCAIYASNSNNLDKPIYEMSIEGNTIPDGVAEYKASGNGLTVVNPVKDANGKFTGGTFITANANADQVKEIIGGVVAEGVEVPELVNGQVVIEGGEEPEYAAYIGTQGYETIQAAVDAADVSDGIVTIKVMAGTHNETVDLKKTNLAFEEGGKTWYGRVNFIGERGAVISGGIWFGNGPDINVADVTIDGLAFGDGDWQINIDNNSAKSGNGKIKNVTIKNNTFNGSGLGPYVNGAFIDGLTVMSNNFNRSSKNNATIGGQTSAINGVKIVGNTFGNFFGLYGQVMDDGVAIADNDFSGGTTGYGVWIKDAKAANAGKIALAGNSFANTIAYPVGFDSTYGKKSDITIGADNTYGGETITGWAEVADHEVFISGSAEESLAQYYNHKLYLGDETAFKTLDAAVAADESGDPLTVVNYDSSMTAPEGWEFKSEGGVTKLVKKAACVAEIGGTKFASINDAFDAVNSQAGDDVTIRILCDVTEELTRDYEWTKDVLITTDDEDGVTVDLGFRYERDLWCLLDDGHLMTIDDGVTILGLGQLLAGWGDPESVVDVDGDVTAQQLWAYCGTANIGPESTLELGYGDGMMKISDSGIVNITGDLEKGAAATLDYLTAKPQANVGYVQSYHYSWPSYNQLNLTDTYMRSTSIVSPRGDSFVASLDNSVIYLYETGAPMIGWTTEASSTLELVNGSRIICEDTVTFDGEMSIEIGSQIKAKGFVNKGSLDIYAEGLAEPVKIIDYDGTGTMTLEDYGEVSVWDGKGWSGAVAYVEDNDLWVKAVSASVAEVISADGTVTNGYPTLAEAFANAISADDPANGSTVRMLEDIDLAGVEWSPVDFRGTFDGNGKTISNLKVSGTMDTAWAGFFSYFRGSARDVTFVGADISGNRCGVFAAMVSNSGPGNDNLVMTFDNIRVLDSKITGLQKCGGLIGFFADSNGSAFIRNCTVDGLQLVNIDAEGIWQSAGLVGYLQPLGHEDVTFTGNTVKDVVCSLDGNSAGYVRSYASGVFIGRLENECDADRQHGETGYGTVILTDNRIEGTNTGFAVGPKTNDYIGDYITVDEIGSTFGGVRAVDVLKVEIDGVDITIPKSAVARVISADGSVTNDYEALAEAVATLKAGWTVTLLADCDESVTGGAVPFVLEKGGKSFTGSIAAADGFKTVESPIAGDDSVRYMPTDEDSVLAAGMVKVASGFYQDAATYTDTANFYITSREGLAYFRDLVNDKNGELDAYCATPAGRDAPDPTSNYRFKNKTVALLSDVDLDSADWTPIGYPIDDRDYMAGAFDGGNHVVSNLKVAYTGESNDYRIGFFGYSCGDATTIRNLTIDNVDVRGFRYAAGLIGCCAKAGALIENCHLTGLVSIYCRSDWVGGIVGQGHCSVRNCSVEGDDGSNITVWGGGIRIGGIYGNDEGDDSVIEDCLVSNLTISVAQNYIAGGIAGSVALGATVSRCRVERLSIQSERGPYLGFVVGGFGGGSGVTVISDCTVAESALACNKDKFMSEQPNTYYVQCGDHDSKGKWIAGAGITVDENGKVTGGVFENIPEACIAEGYEKVSLGTVRPETWMVVKSYEITYDLDTEGCPEGAAMPGDAPKTYTEVGCVLPKPDYESFEVTFGGWLAEGAETTTMVIPAGTTGDLTLKAKWVEIVQSTVDILVKKDADDSTVATLPIKVTTDWVKEKKIDIEDKTDEEKSRAIMVELNDTAANKNLKWQNYVLGLSDTDPDAKVEAGAEQSPSGEVVQVESKLVVPPVDTGYKVVYALDKVEKDADTGDEIIGSRSETREVLIPVDEVLKGDAKVGYAKLKAVLVPESGEGQESVVPAENTIGIMKVESDLEKTIIPVPWGELGGGEIKVSNLIQVSNLTPGDRLYVYDIEEGKSYDASKFRSWELTAAFKWAKIGTATLDENGQQTNDAGKESDDVVVCRGQGVWLERQDVTKPIILSGQYNKTDGDETTDVEMGTESSPVHNILATPLAEEIDLDVAVGNAGKDTIFVPTKGAPRVYSVDKDGKWGYSEDVVLDNGKKIPVRMVGGKLPASSGFWYVSRGGKDGKGGEIKWAAKSAE